MTIEIGVVAMDYAEGKGRSDIKPGIYRLNQASDTGIGMCREAACWAFDLLFTTKSAGKGAGLGLSVTFEIVRRHGDI